MARSISILGYVAALAITFSLLTPALAQVKAPAKKGAETIKGTVVSIEKEKTGKNYKLKLTRSDNDEQLDVSISARTALFVNAKGDEGFLHQGAFVETKATKTDNDLTAEELTVYLGVLNPQPKMMPDETDPEKTFHFAGSIADLQTDAFVLDCGMQSPKINYERGSEVNLKIADPTIIKEGDEVEVEGTMVKSKKALNATGVQVTQSETIKWLDYQAQQDEKKKSKPGAASKTKTTTKSKTETKKSGADGKSAPKSVDPFGIGSSKKGADKDEKDEEAMDADAKDPDAKDPDVKDSTKKVTTKKETTKKATTKKDAKKEAAKEAAKKELMLDMSDNE
jgi:hypothetical protein